MRFKLFEKAAVACGGLFAFASRPLEEDEVQAARWVFGDSIDLTPVRVVSTFIANTPVCLGNNIRVGMDGEISRSTLIHELAHVWQYQTGGTWYVSDSVWCQLASIFRTGSRLFAYELTEADLGAASIHDLPAEKQAMVIEDFFVSPQARRDLRYQRFMAQVRRTAEP